MERVKKGMKYETRGTTADDGDMSAVLTNINPNNKDTEIHV